FFQAEDGIRDRNVTGVQTCALPIFQIDQLKRIRTKNGQNMAFITLNDGINNLDGVVFPDAYKKYESILNTEDTLIVKGKFENRNNKKQLIINQMEDVPTFEDYKLTHAEQIIIRNLEDFTEIEQWLEEQETTGDIPVTYFQENQNQ